MEEDELLPGMGGETFEIRLGAEEFNTAANVIPEPPVEVELENGAILVGRDEIGNDFLRGIANDTGNEADQRVENGIGDRILRYYYAPDVQDETGYVIAHDPVADTAEGTALGAITIQTRRAGRTINEARATYPLEPNQAYENPFPVEETLEHLRTVALEAGLIPIDVEREQALNEAVEETRRRENEGIWHRLRREAGPTTTGGEIYERALAGGEAMQVNISRDGHVTGVRTMPARNISGLKRHIEPFLQRLRMTNEINGETFEKILEHINDY